MIKKPAGAAAGNKIVLAGPDDKLFVGVDTHKSSYHVAVWSCVREQIIAKWVQPAVPGPLMKKLEPVAASISRVTYEAGPTGFELARQLQSKGYNAQVIAASHTPEAKSGEKKCDGVDACKLATYDANNLLTCVRIPTREQDQRRQLARTRQQIVKARSRIKAQIKSFLLYHGIAEPQGLKNWSLASIKALERLELDPCLRFTLDLDLAEFRHQTMQQKRIEGELSRLAKKPDLAPKVEILRSIPYFGEITALTFLLEMHSLERFVTPGAIARYLGLAPNVKSSGQSERHTGLSRDGNRFLKSAMIEAAWRWVGHDEKARELYRHYLLKTGKKQKAIVAVARRLGIMAWHLLMTQTKYDPSRVKVWKADRKKTEKQKAEVVRKTLPASRTGLKLARTQGIKRSAARKAAVAGTEKL